MGLKEATEYIRKGKTDYKSYMEDIEEIRERYGEIRKKYMKIRDIQERLGRWY